MDKFLAFQKDYKLEREFSHNEHAREVFSSILLESLTSLWLSSATDEVKLAMLCSLRLLLRDQTLLQELVASKSMVILCEEFCDLTRKYLNAVKQEESEILSKMVAETTNIFQKISNHSSSHHILLQENSHKQLVNLISSDNRLIVHSSLTALVNLCKTVHGRASLLELYPLYIIMDVITSYDMQCRLLAGDMFLLLSQESASQQQMKDFDLLPNCISLIQSSSQTKSVKQKVIKALLRLLADEELVEEFRVHGGIPVVVRIVSHIEQLNDIDHINLLLSCLPLLCTLCIHDYCAKLVVECNGVYFLSRCLVREKTTEQQIQLNIQVLRTLRYLFSLESNRRLFKNLFPTHIFEVFINIGHYVHDLKAYTHLASLLESLSAEEFDVFRTNIISLDQNKEPICNIGGYAVMELLGTGAYGSVYKAMKRSSRGLFALKVINVNHPCIGAARTQKERDEKIRNIMSEVAMIHEKLMHPNIVHYYTCFQENQHLYIVMNLIEGAQLSEHITSLKEKSMKFTEERLWYIFMQFILALRYLHEEKRIIHRDLKPANLMLGEKDKLTITDFGLAKQQQEFSVAKSVVGTVSYWCPELVQNEQYNKKADIWAAGCVLYEMATLTPAFWSNNMLILAKKISEVEYNTQPLECYSQLVGLVVKKCITLDPNERPDSIQIGSLMTECIMVHLDKSNIHCDVLERKLSRTKEQLLQNQQAVEQKQASLSSRIKRQPTYSTSDSRQSVTVSPMSPLITSTTLITTQSDNDTALSKDEIIDSVFNSQVNVPHHILDTSSSTVDGSLLRNSTEEIETRRRSFSLSPVPSKRSPSGSSLLSMSPIHLKEISDPIGQILNQIHKLIFISQLPPSSISSASYLIVMQYKRALFADSQQSLRFKSEIQKLCNGSNQTVSLVPPCPRLLAQATKELTTINDDGGVPDGIVTYEILRALIEDILGQRGYYSMQNHDH